MRTLIVYYSEENDKVDSIAKQIAEEMDAELFQLGNSASLNDGFHAYYYNHVIFGSPVSNKTIATPIREFIQNNKDEFLEMEFAAFMWREKKHWGDSFKELKKMIGPLKAEMMFTGEQEREVGSFCKLLQNWS